MIVAPHLEPVPLALFLARRMTEETFADGLDELVEVRNTIGSIAGPVQEILGLAEAFAGSFPD